MNIKVPVTRPFFPPREEYEALLKLIWDHGWLTNNGPMCQSIEKLVSDFLECPPMLFLSSGTTALQFAIRTLSLTGEVITSPFSYVATTSSIVWEGCKPVFVDIEPDSLNINPELIERAVTERTSAILATHVYGNPCNIDAIESIAKRYDLKVMYDAAHCFGTQYKGQSVFGYGDITATSFHATKLFHTVEGGAVICRNPEWMNRIELMRNFGFNGIDQFDGVGINGKNSELHAAMGLLNLKYMEDILKKVKALTDSYMELLKDCPVSWIREQPDSSWNRAYMPVIFKDETVMGDVRKALESQGIGTRRYFYPNLATLNYVDSNQSELPVTEDIVKRVLCLPLYFDLTEETQLKIATIIKSMIK